MAGHLACHRTASPTRPRIPQDSPLSEALFGDQIIRIRRRFAISIDLDLAGTETGVANVQINHYRPCRDARSEAAA
jgi:hypothetical protein